MVQILSVIALGCSSKADDDSPGTSDTDDGSPADTETTEVIDTDLLTDTDDTGTVAPPAVDWHVVSAGQHPGVVGPDNGSPCDDVVAELLHDQAALDQWALDQGVGSSLDYVVDWGAEAAVGASTTCSTSNHAVEVVDMTNDGSGAFTAQFGVSDLKPSFDTVTVAWSVIAVDGLDWTQISVVTLD